ncbi:MAG: pyrroline-5-carboxylate reductase [Clostridia bacterium]|nr:pyrroline-5-carboxylate reductase [Clostridia bacterium]
MKDLKIGFLGYGNMGSSLVKGLLLSGKLPAASICATDLYMDKLEHDAAAYGIRAFADAAEMIAEVDWVVLAVKPYQLDQLMPPLYNLLKNKAILSIAAGKDWSQIEELLPGTRHLSTIPNLSVSVGEGILVCEDRHSLSDADLLFLKRVFGKIAALEFVSSDQLGIAGTMSGCGPAYAAMFTEALADAGVKHGLTRETALRLAAQMLKGAASLELSGVHPAILKDRVCSPGGTTIKGVAALEEHAFRGAVIAAIDAVENKG